MSEVINETKYGLFKMTNCKKWNNKTAIQYTKDHKRAYLIVEKALLGKNTIRGYLYDLDKIILYHILSINKVQLIHKTLSRHHNRARIKRDRICQIIDFECCPLTKPDKPLYAREYIYKCCSKEEQAIYEPILKELGL